MQSEKMQHGKKALLPLISGAYKHHIGQTAAYVVLLVATAIYFAFFNAFHFYFAEQTQLFLFSSDYFFSFLQESGGLSEYLANFIIQFFRWPLVSAVIIITSGIVFLIIFRQILRQLKLDPFIFGLLPLLLFFALLSNYHFGFATAIHLLIGSGAFLLLLSLPDNNWVPLTVTSIWTVLFLLIGNISLWLLLPLIAWLIISFKLKKTITAAIVLVIALGGSFLLCQYVWFTPWGKYWIPADFHPSWLYTWAIFWGYFVCIILLSRVIHLRPKLSVVFASRTWTKIALALLMLAGGVALIKKSYDQKSELLFQIDYHVQNEQWNEVLQTAQKYRGRSQLVSYFTNLSLSKLGQLPDQMFHYAQTGTNGLALPWTRSKFTAMFGGEVFYQLNYTSEAYRWAFESQVLNGLHPRSLKRLAITSLIHGNQPLANRYLSLLKQSLFYSDWAKQIETGTSDLLKKEIRDKQAFPIHTDFMADLKGSNLKTKELLENNPNNKPAYEYDMARLLLEKNLPAFAAELEQIQNFGYNNTPIHFQEALLLHLNYTGQQDLPPGCTIEAGTQKRFSEFAKIFAQYQQNQQQAAQAMKDRFGNTFWYYWFFVS